MQITYGDADTFAAMTYAAPSSRMVDYVRNEFARAQQVMSEAGQHLLYRAEQSFNDFMNSDAFRIARAAMHHGLSMWGRNEIQPLKEVWRVQHAPMVMHRWVMAHPELRTLYHRQQCDGFAETYVDAQPGVVGELHDDYRRIHDGELMEEDGELFFENLSTDIETAADELTYEQQIDILQTFNTVDIAIAQNLDPSSKREENLR